MTSRRVQMHQDDPTPAPARYGVAMASVAVALALRVPLAPLLGAAFPFATLFVAVLVSAAYGGFGPALLATALGAIGSVAFLLPLTYGFAGDAAENLGGLGLYVVVSLGIAFIGGALRDA